MALWLRMILLARLAILPAFLESLVSNSVLPSAMETSERTTEKQAIITFRNLYPTLTEQELRDAEENLRRYIEVALRIHEEHHSEGHPDFDTSPIPSTMKERSKFPLKT